MKFNKDYMAIMRRGKLNLGYYDIKKQNNPGIVLGTCMALACLIILVGIFNH